MSRILDPGLSRKNLEKKLASLSHESKSMAIVLLKRIEKLEALQRDAEYTIRDIRGILLDMIASTNRIEPQTVETRRSIAMLTRLLDGLSTAVPERKSTPRRSWFPKLAIIVLSIIAILAISLFSLAADVRNAAYHFITGKVSVAYESTGSTSLSLAGLHAPTVLPEGYALVGSNISRRGGTVGIAILTYQRPDGNTIRYYYYGEGEAAALDNEHADVTRVDLDGYTAMISEGEDGLRTLSGRVAHTDTAAYRLEGYALLEDLEIMAQSIALHAP